jgi:hypothetical protein
LVSGLEGEVMHVGNWKMVAVRGELKLQVRGMATV